MMNLLLYEKLHNLIIVFIIWYYLYINEIVKFYI